MTNNTHDAEMWADFNLVTDDEIRLAAGHGKGSRRVAMEENGRLTRYCTETGMIRDGGTRDGTVAYILALRGLA